MTAPAYYVYNRVGESRKRPEVSLCWGYGARSPEFKAARICKAKYQRGDWGPERKLWRSADNPLVLFYSADCPNLTK